MKNKYLAYWIVEIINFIVTVIYLILLAAFNRKLASLITTKNLFYKSFEILAYGGGKAFNFLIWAFIFVFIRCDI